MVKQTLQYTCSYCDSCIEEVFSLAFGDVAVRPGAPPGWSVLDGVLVCDKHQIQIEDIRA